MTFKKAPRQRPGRDSKNGTDVPYSYTRDIVMPIEKLSRPVSEYITNFDLRAIGLRANGKLRITRNPAGYVNAWWSYRARQADEGGRTQGGRSIAPRATDEPALGGLRRDANRAGSRLRRVLINCLITAA